VKSRVKDRLWWNKRPTTLARTAQYSPPPRNLLLLPPGQSSRVTTLSRLLRLAFDCGNIVPNAA
jgi:hypothetical protein